MRGKKINRVRHLAVFLAILCGLTCFQEPVEAARAAERILLQEDGPAEPEVPPEEGNSAGGPEAPPEEAGAVPEPEALQEELCVSEAAYGGIPETLYPRRNGYYDLLVYDGTKSGRYRIYVQVGTRVPGSASYSLSYSMSLTEGEDLGITIAPEAYATRYDNADGYPEEVRQYHLPVRFIHEKQGYHFEAADTSGCYQTYFSGMGDEFCDFVVDTNGCGMTNWGEDGLYHNDVIRVKFVPNQYTISYDGNGATGGSVPDQTVGYDTWVTLAPNTYEKSYSVRYDGMGGTVSGAEDRAVCQFLGWQDRNDFNFDGVDYHWYTFDAPYYANSYGDLMQTFGYDKAALISHYMTYVVQGAETRSGSPCFNAGEYMDVGGGDLKQIFGADRAAYVSHWNSYGYGEKRRGRIQADQDIMDVYGEGAAVRNLTGHLEGRVTLTAGWSEGYVTLPEAVREGYELLGWSRTPEAEEPDHLPGEEAAVNEDCTFYAVWKKTKQFFNVAYIGNGQDEGGDFVDYRIDPEEEYALYLNGEDGKEGAVHFTRGQMVSFTSAVTGDTVEEETTQTVVGWSLQETGDRNDMYPLGMLWKGEELYLQAQAAGNLTIGSPGDAYGTAAGVVNGSGLPQDAPEDYVNLYAVWDGGAVIEAYDLYYTLEEARSGKITQEELLSHAVATDAEAADEHNGRGILKPGVDEAKKTQFVVCDYDAGELQAFCHGGSVTETYLAVDSAGNETRRQITVHIVDTEAQKQPDERAAIRFISREYLDTLPRDSVWVQDAEYRERLEETLALAEQKK